MLNPNNTDDNPDPAQPTQSVAFDGASSASNVPYTTGIATPTSALPTPTGAGAGAGGAGASPSASATPSFAAGLTMQSSGMGIAAVLGAGMAWLLV